jgi:choline monooxygenase
MINELSSDTKRIFNANRFAAHTSYVRPNEVVPCFFAKSKYFMTNTAGVLQAHANSCLHRGAKLVERRYFVKPDQPIACPLHGKLYNYQGQVVEKLNLVSLNECVPTSRYLYMTGLKNLHGLWFEENSLRRPMSGLSEEFPTVNSLEELFKQLADFGIHIEDYIYDQEQITINQVGWRTFMEIHLDDAHLIAHPMTLGSFVQHDSMWIFGNEWSLQVMQQCYTPYIKRRLGWQKYAEQVVISGNHSSKQDSNGLCFEKPYGAIYVTIYPGVMLEFYPHVMVISVIVPVSETKTAHYSLLCYDKYGTENFDLQNAFLDAHSEISDEDNHLRDLLEDGRAGQQLSMWWGYQVSESLDKFREWMKGIF